MTDGPLGAPAPQPDTERHPRTRITRLPYVVVAIIALAGAVIWGAITARERATAEREMVGLQVVPPASPTPPAMQAPPR